MRQPLLMLLFYFCLAITVGKQMRILSAQLRAEKNISPGTFSLDYSQSDAENEESGSEDSEESGEDCDNNELVESQILVILERTSAVNYPSPHCFESHQQEIGTPPPRC